MMINFFHIKIHVPIYQTLLHTLVINDQMLIFYHNYFSFLDFYFKSCVWIKGKTSKCVVLNAWIIQIMKLALVWVSVLSLFISFDGFLNDVYVWLFVCVFKKICKRFKNVWFFFYSVCLYSLLGKAVMGDKGEKRFGKTYIILIKLLKISK